MQIKKMVIKGSMVHIEYLDDFKYLRKNDFKFGSHKQAVENFNKLAKQYGGKKVETKGAQAKTEFKGYGEVKKAAVAKAKELAEKFTSFYAKKGSAKPKGGGEGRAGRPRGSAVSKPSAKEKELAQEGLTFVKGV